MGLKRHSSNDLNIDHTPASAVTAGAAIQLGDGAVGVPPNDIAANRLGAVDLKGVFKVDAATATTWSDGDEIWYDASAGLAVKKSNALDGDTDFRLGPAVGAKASGPLFGYVRLNDPRPPFDPIIFEFDCDGDNGDTDNHVLVPAEMNPNGLLVLGIYGIVTEVFAGSSEDQGIITVRDESNNSLGTLTPSDSAADVVGDIVVGYSAPAASTGAAAKLVAAGEFIDAQVTQQTSGGTPAGKIKVYIVAVPLV